MPRTRQTILRNFVFLTVAMLLLTSAVGATAIWFLGNVGDSAKTVYAVHLPLLSSARSLASDASALADLSTQLGTVGSEGERATLFDRIQARHHTIGAQIASLRALGLDSAMMDQVEQTVDRLTLGAETVNRLVQSEHRLSAEFTAKRLELLDLCAAPATTGAQTACTTALSVLASAPNAASLAEAKSDLRGEQLVELVFGQNGISPLKRELDDVQNRTQNLIRQQRETALALLGITTRLANQTESMVMAQQSQAADSVLRMRIGLGIALAGTLLAGFLGYRYFHRQVILRLLGLKTLMVNWRVEKGVEAPATVRDEIDAMTGALSQLMETIRLRNLELEHLAATDSLTGLLNRRIFMQRANEELSRAHRYQTKLAVLMADIDRFKSINDRFGHQVGDQVIQQMADIWRAQLRKIDVAGRIGGEEFAVIMPETDLEAARMVAERVRQMVERSHIPLPNGQTVTFTLSVGLAEVGSGDTVNSALSRADDAMYQAKRGGRNRVFPPPGSSLMVELDGLDPR